MRSLAIAASLFFPLGLLFADHWERFHGPNGAGIASGADIPASFDATKGILWKVNVRGLGNSSPIVWDNRLFIQSATTDAKERLLLCYDAVKGDLVWSRSVPGTLATIKDRNTFASSTPATDGQSVFITVWDGKDVHLQAYDFAGTPLWSKNLGLFNSEHGFGASPVVYQDLVLFNFDSDDKAVFQAFHKKDGSLAWQAPRKWFHANYSPPLIRSREGKGDEIIQASSAAATGYDPKNGAVLWEWNWKFSGKDPMRVIAGPLLIDNILFVSSGTGTATDRLSCAIDLKDTQKDKKPPLLWETRKDAPYVTSSVSRGDYIYFASDAGYVGCYHARTGKQMWYQRADDAYFISSPVIANDRLFACGENGDVYVYRAEPNYEILAKNPLGETIRATPAIADNRLYIRGQNHLFCIGNPR